MSQENSNTEVEQKLSQNELIDKMVENVKNNNFCIHFYCPPMNLPSGGIGVLLKIAKKLTDNDFKVKIWYEPRFNENASYEASNKIKSRVDIFDRFNPTWVDFDISKLEFIPLGEPNGTEILFTDGHKQKPEPLMVNPEDIFIIPEGFPNIMEKTAKLTCRRVVLAQSWSYVFLGMKPSQIWQHFGIKDVISVSDFITEFLETTMPGLSIKKLNQSINREVFNVPEKRSDKYPMIGFQRGRGQESQIKIENITRLFYNLHPHLRWVRFTELYGMDRKTFAETLKSCSIVLYTDDIAGFGTLPLEAMACGTHVVGYAAEGGREYTREDNGFWSQNGDVFQTVELLGIACEKLLSGELDSKEIIEKYESTLADYTEEGESKRILEIINEFKTEKINELEAFKKQ